MAAAEIPLREPDIAIVGAGPVGMALALALHHSGMACRLLDARARGAARLDRRVLALSHGSLQILDRLGAWPDVAATPIETIHISQQGGFGRTLITARELGVPALGYVVNGADLAAALDEALAARGVPIEEHVQVESLAANAQDAILNCSRDGRAQLAHARLVAFAEGGVHGADDSVSRNYEQTAVICTARAATPRGNIAYERFTAHGPLALLPHDSFDGAGYAVVLVTEPAEAQQLIERGDAQFLEHLQRCFGERVRFSAVSARAAYPLTLRYRRDPIGMRCVYLGNSAQTLHPVAGQGLNLALRDVWTLARVLAGETQAPLDPGSEQVLRRYASARRIDRGGAIGFTDGLIRVFSNRSALLRALRGSGLVLLDLLPPARAFVAKRMIFGARAWP